LQVGLYIRFKSYKVIVSLYREKKKKEKMMNIIKKSARFESSTRHLMSMFG
jgi:uncharacterized protein YcgL (UPF0745 family)